MFNSHNDLNFEVIEKTNNFRYANGNDIRLVKLGPIVSFSSFQITSSSGKHVEDFNHADIVSFQYKLLPSGRGSCDLSIGFYRDRGRSQQEFSNKKNFIKIPS